MSEKTINLTVKISGFVALAIGAGLLVFTFMTAYGFLQGLIELSLPGDIMGAFGEALAPLIDTGIKAIFLGIMGWTGSILSRRGVQVLISPVARTQTNVEKRQSSE